MLELYLNVLEARERVAQATLHQAHDSEVHEASRRLRVFELRRAQAELMRAEREVYLRLQPMAHHKLKSCRADEADKEDLRQDICIRVLKTGVLERRREGGEGRAKVWTWRVVESAIASRCRKRPPPTPGGEAMEAVAAGAEALPLAGSVGGREADQLAALLACAREGAMAVVRSRGEVPSWLDQEWSRSQVPRTVAGLTRALEVCCRTSFDKEELSDVARALDLSMPVASRARGRGKQALRLGASMALHLGCCDLSTRSRLEAFSVALGTADLPTSTGDT